MDDKIMRFFTFIKTDKVRNFVAFLYYFLFIATLIDLPSILEIICLIARMLIIMLVVTMYLDDIIIEKWKTIRTRKTILNETKKIAKEILMYIPVLFISACITSSIMVGQPVNQTNLDELAKQAPIFSSIYTIIIAPIIEEVIFRFLPYKFIKNKTLYIIISAVIFAAMHVIHDPNAFYYIWFYMMEPLYYAYRYHKTQDILVSISMHSLNNLLATLPRIFSYF